MARPRYTLQFVRRRQRRVAVIVYWIAGAGVLAVLFWLFVWNTTVETPRSAQPMPKPPTAAAKVPATKAAPPAPQPVMRIDDRPGVRSVRDTLEAQIALDRLGISSGSIDGVLGGQTRAALQVFQRQMNLPATGALDAATRQALRLASPALGVYTITAEDIARLRPLGASWLAKSQQDRLDYETPLELLGEKFHAHPRLLQRLNPVFDWTNAVAGVALNVPRVESTTAGHAARVRIQLASRSLEVFDERGALLAHFPCSIAQKVDKRPVGELHVAVVAPNPNYTFDPAIFRESTEAQQLGRKLILPPGPNNPVGTAWIGLDKPGYGIHGTPNPEAVGRTESHGCFRLANWNADLLLRLVWVGMPVVVEP